MEALSCWVESINKSDKKSCIILKTLKRFEQLSWIMSQITNTQFQNLIILLDLICWKLQGQIKCCE
jgi:hypothetical protein